MLFKPNNFSNFAQSVYKAVGWMDAGHRDTLSEEEMRLRMKVRSSGLHDFSRHVQTLRHKIYAHMGWTYHATSAAPAALLPLRSLGMISSLTGIFDCKGELSGKAYGGQDFVISDVTSRAPENIIDNVETSFKGCVVSLAYPGTFAGRTIIKDDLGWANPSVLDGMKRVGMVDRRFEDMFEIYADDQVQARALITPDFMERLMAFRSHYLGQGVQCIFMGGHIHVALNIDDKFDFTRDIMAFNYQEAADILVPEVGSVCLLLEQIQTLQASIGRMGASGADKARQKHYTDMIQMLIPAVKEMEGDWDNPSPLSEDLRHTQYLFCEGLRGLAMSPRF